VIVPRGQYEALEESAYQMLLADRRLQQSPHHADKHGWLTCEQIELRQNREVLVPTGVPDAAVVRGIYRRAWNPMAGKRPVSRRRLSLRQDPWGQDCVEFFGFMNVAWALPIGRSSS
jgi:hypothetical protein